MIFVCPAKTTTGGLAREYSIHLCHCFAIFRPKLSRAIQVGLADKLLSTGRPSDVTTSVDSCQTYTSRYAYLGIYAQAGSLDTDHAFCGFGSCTPAQRNTGRRALGRSLRSSQGKQHTLLNTSVGIGNQKLAPRKPRQVRYT